MASALAVDTLPRTSDGASLLSLCLGYAISFTNVVVAVFTIGLLTVNEGNPLQVLPALYSATKYSLTYGKET